MSKKSAQGRPPLHLDEGPENELSPLEQQYLDEIKAENRQEACLDKFRTIDFKYLVDNQVCLGEVILERMQEGKKVYCLQKLRETVEVILQAKGALDGK